MHDWIVGIQKAAKNAHPGFTRELLRRAENELGEELPDELAALYARLGGGELPGDVCLYRLHDVDGVIEKSRKKMVGLPAAGLWRFGRKGAHRHLFVARVSSLRQQAEGVLPEWCGALADDAWLYGSWDESTGELRLYRSLEQLLSVLVPPVQTEDFGEVTFARALTAVEHALASMKGESLEDELPPGAEVSVSPARSKKTGAGKRVTAAITAGRKTAEKAAKTSAKKAKKAKKAEAAEKAPAKAKKAKPAKVSAKKAKAAEQAPAKAKKAKTAKKTKPAKVSAKKAKTAKKAKALKAPAKKAPAKKTKAKVTKAPAKKARASKKAKVAKAPARKAKAATKKAKALKAPARKARGTKKAGRKAGKSAAS